MGTKISELVSGSPAAVLTGAEGLELTQSGNSVGALASQLRDYVDSGIAERTSTAYVVPTLSSLKALTNRPEAVLVETGQAKGVWQWEAASSTTADDALVVEPTSGTAGRYKRIYDGVKNAEWFGLSTAGAGAANITALQAALTSGGDIYIPAGTYTLASTQLVPVSNSTIRGVQGQTILSRTGSDVTSYIRPFFNVEDVDNVTFDGLTLDFTVDTSREYAILCRATALGDTTNIRVRNCTFNNLPNHIQRYCRDVWFEGNVFDGGGATGALCGVATGGTISKTTGAGSNDDGLVQNVFIYDNILRNIRQEGVDINQDTSDVVIDGNQFIDCNLAGGVTNEVIDIGGVNSMDNGCRRIAITNNNISWTAATASCGITIKIYSQDVTVTGNTLYNPDISTSGCGGIVVTDLARNVTITGNTVRGFLTGIGLTASSTGTTENVTVAGNAVDAYGSAGIVVVTGAFSGVSIKGNTLESTAGTAISLANVTNWSVSDNIVRGAAVDCILINTTATDGNVTSNVVTGSTVDGIRVLGARVTIDGNTTYSNGRHGINAGADNLTITGNTSYNNAQVTANQFGLNIAANSDYIVIVGNNIFDTQGGSATQNGIVFGATCTNITLGPNNIGPVKTTAISGLANISASTVSGIGANAAQSATIASGVVTCSAGVTFLTLDTEGAGATDDLDTLNYSGVSGDVVTIKAASASRDVVVKDATGNIHTAGDMTLNNTTDTITLKWDGSLWRELCRSDNGA